MTVQDREDKAATYRERIAAVKKALEQHDREVERARHQAAYPGKGGGRWADWRGPSEAMRKVRRVSCTRTRKSSRTALLGHVLSGHNDFGNFNVLEHLKKKIASAFV